MKARYIKPETAVITSIVMESLLNSASRANIEGGPNGNITTDNTEEGGEAAGAAAKDYNAWSTWDE